MNNEIRKQDVIFASGEFLTQRLPLQFDTWSEDLLLDFITKNSSEVFDMCDPSYVFELIERMAESVRLYIEDNNKQNYQ